jgi:hypothetical protein
MKNAQHYIKTVHITSSSISILKYTVMKHIPVCPTSNHLFLKIDGGKIQTSSKKNKNGAYHQVVNTGLPLYHDFADRGKRQVKIKPKIDYNLMPVYPALT